MRTTLDIDPTALALVRQLASHRGESLGRVVSDLILSGARASAPSAPRTKRNGFPVRPAASGQAPITGELVQRLLDEEP